MSALIKAGSDDQKFAVEEEGLWAAIGAKREERLFAQRVLALSNPEKYASSRATQLESLKKSAAAAADAAYNAFVDAGYGRDQAKLQAIRAGRATYESGMKGIRAGFPSATDALYQVGVTTPNVARNMRKKRAAPTKRKAAKKSKARR